MNAPIISLRQTLNLYLFSHFLVLLPPPPFQHWHHTSVPLLTVMNIRKDLATSKTASTTPTYNTTVASFYCRATLHFNKYVNCHSKLSLAAMFIYASFHVFITCPVQTTVFSLLTPSFSALRATSIFRTRSQLSAWQISRVVTNE